MCCAELSLSCVGHRRGQWGWPGRAGRQLSLPTAASCWAPLLRLGGIKLLEAAMCHQGPTASHFKSVNLLFFKLVTLALLSSYTTLNGRSSGRRTHIGHKQQRERKILFIKLDIMDRGWVLHTPGPASCTGWQSTRWYHPCTPEIWNQDAGWKTSLYYIIPLSLSHTQYQEGLVILNRRHSGNQQPIQGRKLQSLMFLISSHSLSSWPAAPWPRPW